MSRQEDFEQSIRESYGIIREYEAILRTSDRPEEKVRARRVIREQWALVEGCLDEYRPLVGGALPDEIGPDRRALFVAGRSGPGRAGHGRHARAAARRAGRRPTGSHAGPAEGPSRPCSGRSFGASGAVAQEHGVAAGEGAAAIGGTWAATIIVAQKGPRSSSARRRWK